LIAQLPNATAPEIGTWLISCAAVMAIVTLAISIYGKLFPKRHPPIETEFATKRELKNQAQFCIPRIDRIEREFLARVEFQDFKREIREELVGISSRIASTNVLVIEKLDVMKGDLMAAGERRASVIHARINDMSSLVSRVDERTKQP
jgi:hypothetical protein